jgi:hypothetical protein
MNRNYPRPETLATREQLRAFGGARETHEIVVAAIFAIADRKRPADSIWAAPTSAEWDHVTMAVEEYLTHGDFDREPNGRYPWGEATIEIGN